MDEKIKQVSFKVTGGFDIPENYQPEYDAAGNVTGYRLPDNRVVQLIVALEVAAPEENGYDNVANLQVESYEYVTKESEMGELGFNGLDYDELIFPTCETVTTE